MRKVSYFNYFIRTGWFLDLCVSINFGIQSRLLKQAPRGKTKICRLLFTFYGLRPYPSREAPIRVVRAAWL